MELIYKAGARVRFIGIKARYLLHRLLIARGASL